VFVVDTIHLKKYLEFIIRIGTELITILAIWKFFAQIVIASNTPNTFVMVFLNDIIIKTSGELVEFLLDHTYGLLEDYALY
jgi:hypothetical protein